MSSFRSFLHFILLESRVDDVKESYPNVDPKVIDHFVKNDPSRVNKYLIWMVRQVDAGEPAEEVLSLATLFHTKGIKLPVKDLNRYKTLGDLRDAFEKLEPTKTEKLKSEKSDADTVFDDGRFIIIHPKTMEASCHYGRGTKWCISALMSENYFDTYAKDNVLFYFLIDRKMSEDDPKYKIALLIMKSKSITKIYEAYDSSDRKISVPKLKKEMEDSILDHAKRQPNTIQYRLNTPGEIISEEELEKALRGKSAKLKVAIVKRTDNPEKIAGFLAKDENRYVRWMVAQYENVSPKILEYLSDDPEDGIRQNIAVNSRTPVDVLKKLAKDVEVFIRLSVVSNLNTPLNVLQILAHDENENVRSEALERIKEMS